MIIDASVWVACVLAEDAHHAASLSFIRKFVMTKRTALHPALAWPEIAGAIARRTGDAELGMQVVQTIVTKRWVRTMPIDTVLAHHAIRLAAMQRLRGADAIYVALAVSQKMPLITLDAEILARAGEVAQVMTPAQWLQQG